MSKGKEEAMTCPECHRGGHHTIHCSAGRCQRCRRAPALLNGYCGFCWRDMKRARQKAVAERLAQLDGDGDK
jgi:hypothetical protein